MSEKFMEISATEKIREWAEKIIAAQKREIAAMKGALDELGDVDRDEARNEKIKESLNK